MNRRLLGLLLAPFAVFAGCVGLTSEEQAEYRELQEEVRRIQAEEISPRKDQLREVIEGKFVVDIAELEAQVNHVRNERIEPMNQRLAALKSGEQAHAAPGTRIDLEELNTRLAELELLHAGLEGQVIEHREQLVQAKAAASAELEAQIADLEIQLKETSDTDEKAAIEAQIEALWAEIQARQIALIDQFELLIHGIELSMHDISEEKATVIQEIHELELASHEELGKTIEDLEILIEETIASELRPLIEQLNAATDGGDASVATKERLMSEIEDWLARLAETRARVNELTSKSLRSMLSGLNLEALAGA